MKRRHGARLPRGAAKRGVGRRRKAWAAASRKHCAENLGQPATHFRLVRKGFYFTAAETQIHGRESESIIVSENIAALSFREHIHYYAQADRLLV